MPVYHFTLHAYRSWRPDHRRGYTRRKTGYLPPDPQIAKKYDVRARQEPAIFVDPVQRIIIRTTHDFCARRKLRFHASGNDPSHTHLIISWRNFASPVEILRRLKNILALELNRTLNCKRKWFVRNSSHRRVKDNTHLMHLLVTYLPDHPGIFWREGMKLP